jgi:replicative DNA helicase
MFLFRDEYYKKEKSEKQDEAEVIIAKNRHGSLGNVKLGWYGEFTKFATKSDREEE